jgi:hypothetical protein
MEMQQGSYSSLRSQDDFVVEVICELELGAEQ